jgi:hypothetical protein
MKPLDMLPNIELNDNELLKELLKALVVAESNFARAAIARWTRPITSRID